MEATQDTHTHQARPLRWCMFIYVCMWKNNRTHVHPWPKMDSSLHLVPGRYKLPTAPGGSLRKDGPGWEKAENKFTATSGLPACVCVCPVSPPCIHVCRLCAGADWGEKVARELLSDRPTQYTARCPFSTRRAAHSMHRTYRPVSGLLGKIPIHLTLFGMITKKLHHICFFFNTILYPNLPGWTHGIKWYWLL